MVYALGIDVSTQSCSALVVDTQTGDFVAEASINYGERLPQYGALSGFIPDGGDGEVHSDPCMWLDALELLLADLKAKCDLSKVAAISGAGQQHGSVYLNERWLPLIGALHPAKSLSRQIKPCLSRLTSPIWMDGSTGAQCREIAQSVGGDSVVCQKSGSIAIERFTGPQIRRFHKLNPDAYAETVRIHLVSSFICSVLCGADTPVDTGDGAGMNLLNINTWEWDDELLGATAPDLLERLPRVVPGTTRVGEIAQYFVDKFGFAAGTPVTVFTGDNPSSLVGMGASQPGKVVVSLGTSDTFFAAMPKVVSDPEGFGHALGNPMGGSMSLQCFINGSLAREAVKNQHGFSWQTFTQALRDRPPGNGGQLMLPFFRPEISPRIHLSTPVLKGSPAFESGKDPTALVRACVEGQFLNMKLRSAWMNLNPEMIFLTGGASQNEAIAQIVADIFQSQVQRLAITSSVALGSAMRAAQNALGLNLSALEAQFCHPEADSMIEPSVGPDVYSEALDEFSSLIAAQI